MDLSKVSEWLKDVSPNNKTFISVVAIICATLAFVFSPENFLKLLESVIVDSNPPATANDQATVNQHVGDTHHYGLSVEDAMKLAEKLAAEKGEKDAQVIKSLQETIQALTQVNAQKYDIKRAFELLDQGDTIQAEAIFSAVAAEAKQAGKAANNREAEALRHLGSLAFLHDTQKSFAAYKRSTELDPNSLVGWNQLGHLYKRLGELENAESAYKVFLELSWSDKKNQSIAYTHLGNVYKIRGELDTAIKFFKKSLAIEEEIGHKEGMAINYTNLAVVYGILGKLSAAIENYRHSLNLDCELNNKKGISENYTNLGNLYLTLGELDVAIEFFEKSLMIEEELGQKEVIAANYSNLGRF